MNLSHIRLASLHKKRSYFISRGVSENVALLTCTYKTCHAITKQTKAFSESAKARLVCAQVAWAWDAWKSQRLLQIYECHILDTSVVLACSCFASEREWTKPVLATRGLLGTCRARRRTSMSATPAYKYMEGSP